MIHSVKQNDVFLWYTFSMNVYHYHPTTGEYVGQSEADPSPLEPGVFLVPAYATSVAPPSTCTEGYFIAWDGNAWAEVAIPPPEPVEPEPPRDPVEEMRRMRNAKLNESDYRAFPDYPLTEEQRTQWNAYRQALRDVPSMSTPSIDESGQLVGVVWPEPPF